MTNPKFLAVICPRSEIRTAIFAVRVEIPLLRGPATHRAPDVTLVAASPMGPEHDLVLVSRRPLDSEGIEGAREMLAAISYQVDPEPIALDDAPAGAKFVD